MSDQLDEMFLIRARERGLLSESQVKALRSEVKLRRRREPDIGAHELAVEKGWLGVEAALALLDAKPEDTVADLTRRISEGEIKRYDTEPETEKDALTSLQPETSSGRGNTERFASVHDIEINPDDEAFGAVPKLVEPLPSKYAIADSSSTDSHLEMELPPPPTDSGDSIFEEEGKQVQALDAELDGPAFLERTPTGRRSSESELQPFGRDTALGAGLDDLDIGDDIGDEEEIVSARAPSQPELAPVSSGDTLHEENLREIRKDTERFDNLRQYKPQVTDAGRTASDTSDGESRAPVSPELAPAFSTRGSKGANVDFAAFGEDDVPLDEVVEESEEVSSKMNDSAVGEVMEEADDSYFGPPVDLTITPPELMEDSIAPPKPLDSATLFDSESLKDSAPASPVEVDEFVATVAPAAPVATRRPSSEVTKDSDVSVPSDFPADDLSTVYDDSNVSLVDMTDESSKVDSEVTTGSRTQFATGEMARPGLRNRTDSKLGVESTGGDGSDVITGKEMTLADLRQQMGLGQGVKIGSPDGSMTRLRKASKKKRYAVIREIARGGMGKVIEVEDNDLRRSVALKVLRKEMLDRKDLVERFLEEAQITGQLEHPNIVPVHEIGVDGRGNLYFTMKLVEGEELSSIIKRLRKNDPSAQQAYPIARLVDIFIKVCEGVSFAHSRGVIHRDLKPANIMVGRFGEVQIMDWGVAKIIGRKEDTADRAVVSDRQDDDAARTMAGSILGTPSYMSPEQARGEVNTMGAVSDIFSLGVIMYELLALVTPWTAQTSAQVLDQVKIFEPDLPSKRDPARRIPPELEKLAMKCIEKAPNKRIQTAQELIDNLRQWQEGGTLAAVEYSIGQIIGKWISRHKVGLVMIMLVLGALGFGGFFAYQAAQQVAQQRAETSIAEADNLLKQSRDSYAAKQWTTAEEQASAAGQKYQGALNTLGNDERAEKGLNDANIARAEAAIAVRTEKDEARRIADEKDRKQKLDSALANARGLYTTAKEADANPGMDASAVREAFLDAGKAFEKVLVIDDTNAEAKLAVGQIADWEQKYEARRKGEEDLKNLRALVGFARNGFDEAMKLTDYRQVTQKLVKTISQCDQAVAVNVSGPAADKLRDEAQSIKAEAALAFANRAIDGGHYDVADLMLTTGEGTGKLLAEINAARDILDNKVEEQSRFTRLLTAARADIAAQDWVLAQSSVAAALAEAKTSQYASDKDRSELARMLELAQLEEVRAKDVLAKSAEDLTRVFGDYEALVADLKDADYKNRAVAGLDGVRGRLGAALYNEALESSDDRVQGEMLARALDFITDKVVISDIKSRLAEIKVRIALAQESDKHVLLPRGNFVLGSNREGDNNAQHMVEHREFVFVNKYLVTNAEYQAFVAAGGYTNTDYWSEDAAPYVSLFTDTTGQPGPANWAQGGFDASLANYPVTGICWHEAMAYAKWAEMRLATADEWEIAAGAPRTDEPAAVGDYPFGAREQGPQSGVMVSREVGTTEWDGSPTGVRDLGSNVAEWTSSLSDGKAIVKGAEPGLRAELFFRYARRAKNSLADSFDRSAGRGFRCAKDLNLTEEGDD